MPFMRALAFDKTKKGQMIRRKIVSRFRDLSKRRQVESVTLAFETEDGKLFNINFENKITLQVNSAELNECKSTGGKTWEKCTQWTAIVKDADAMSAELRTQSARGNISSGKKSGSPARSEDETTNRRIQSRRMSRGTNETPS